MSRAALWRQEGNVLERERRAEEVYQTAVEEGRERAARSKAVLPLWGPDDSFHWNGLLLRNTIHSSYFQKCCQNLIDWNAVIDEIYYEVKHLEPFTSKSDKTPSTAFCLLLRLLTLRMTDHQMELTLKHADSPYIRAIGFLYLRYVGPPEQILERIQPYLYDDEELVVESGPSASSSSRSTTTTTMGEFVRGLFQSREFHGTALPRFPLEVERSIQVLLLQAEKVAQRAAQHAKNATRMAYFQTVGNEVMALYGDEENQVTWYKAVVDRVITRDADTGTVLPHPKFVVTFPEYGNTETVMLGELDSITEGNWKDDHHPNRGRNAEGAPSSSSSSFDERRNRDPHETNHRRDGRAGGNGAGGSGAGGSGAGGGVDCRRDHRSQDYRDRRTEVNLYDEVRRRERNTATAGKGDWARRPPSTKAALASQGQRGRHSLQDDPPAAADQRRKFPHHPREDPNQLQDRSGLHRSFGRGTAPPANEETSTSRKRSAVEMAAIQAKKRNLMAKYG